MASAASRINCFLPHMRTNLREMSRRLSSVDLVLEVRDARVPFTSASSLLDELVGRDRRRLVVLNKADLSDPSARKGVTAAIERQGYSTYWSNANQQHSVTGLLNRALGTFQSERPTADLSLMMVVGMPNVGKSSLTNALRDAASHAGLRDMAAHLKKTRARTGSLPGVTRHINGFKVSQSPLVYVMDTAGLLLPGPQARDSTTLLALTGAIPAATVDVAAQASLLLRLLQQPRHWHQLCKAAGGTSTSARPAAAKRDVATTASNAVAAPSVAAAVGHTEEGALSSTSSRRGGGTRQRQGNDDVGVTRRRDTDVEFRQDDDVELSRSRDVGSRRRRDDGASSLLAQRLYEALDTAAMVPDGDGDAEEAAATSSWSPDESSVSVGAAAAGDNERRRLSRLLRRLGVDGRVDLELEMCRRLVAAFQAGHLGRYTFDDIPPGATHQPPPASVRGGVQGATLRALHAA